MFYVICPTCTKTLSVNPENAGKVVQCPQCKEKLLVPAASTATTPMTSSQPVATAPTAPPAFVTPTGPPPQPNPSVPLAAPHSVASSATSVAPAAAPPVPAASPVPQVPSAPGVFQVRCFACPATLTVPDNPPESLPLCEKCQQAFTSRRLRKPFCVRVSAAAVRWPSFCACCCKRANSLQRLSHTKTTEAKYIEREKLSWEVPYCLHCIEHAKLQQYAAGLMTSAGEELKRAAKKLDTAAKKEGRVTGRSIGLGVFWGVFTFLMGTIVFNPLVLQRVFFQTETIGSLFPSWLGISVLFFFVGALLGVFLWYMGRQKDLETGEKKVDRAERSVVQAQTDLQRSQGVAREAQLRAQSFLQPSCSALDLAVHYVGWEGFTHVFYFDSEKYAVAFVTMNRGNVVEPSLL